MGSFWGGFVVILGWIWGPMDGFGVRRGGFGVVGSKFGVRKAKFGVRKAKFGVDGIKWGRCPTLGDLRLNIMGFLG